MGSFACRGLPAQPTERVTITGNKWGYSSALTASSMHPSFWNCFEVNNAKECVVRYNTAACTRLGGNGVRGFFLVQGRCALRAAVREEYPERV